MGNGETLLPPLLLLLLIFFYALPENNIHETLFNIWTCTPHENFMQNQTKMQKIYKKDEQEEKEKEK